MYEKLTILITITILAIASYTDLKYRRVPNWLTFPGMITGILLCGIFERGDLVSRLIWLAIFFFIGMLAIMGMGDLKLMMAVIALRGIMTASITLLAGAMLLLVYCIVTEGPKKVLDGFKLAMKCMLLGNYKNKFEGKEYPFAVFISMGYVCTIMIRMWCGW